MPDISQDTIAAAGLAPSATDMTFGAVQDAYKRKGALQEKITASEGKTAALDQQKGEALAPLQDKAMAALQAPPPPDLKQEAAQPYVKPTLNPKDVQDSFGLMLAASMLVGLGSRAPFSAAMQAMTGALTGFQNKDDKLVEQSLKSFDANLAVIKEKNEALRSESEAAWKKYQGDPQRYSQEMQIIAAKYDLHLNAEQAQHASYDSQVKELDNTINSLHTAADRAERIKESVRHDHETEQTAKQARLDAEQAHRDSVMLARERQGAGNNGGGTISPQYGTDPEYKKRVDTWAKMVKAGTPLPSRFAQMVGKQMAGDVFKIAGDADAGDMVANRINQRELTSEATKIGSQSASVAIANKEVAKFIPMAVSAVDAVARVGWRPVNDIIKKAESSWSPEEGRLVIANRSLLTAYAQLIQRGAPTVHSLGEAESMLNGADSPQVYKAKADQLAQEGVQAEQALRDTQKELTEKARALGNGGDTAAPPSSGKFARTSAAPNAPYADPEMERRYQESKRAQGAAPPPSAGGIPITISPYSGVPK